MKVFLVVMATLGSFYSGNQLSPTMIKELPNMASCRAIADVVRKESRNRVVARCVLAKKDYN